MWEGLASKFKFKLISILPSSHPPAQSVLDLHSFSGRSRVESSGLKLILG